MEMFIITTITIIAVDMAIAQRRGMETGGGHLMECGMKLSMGNTTGQGGVTKMS